jgi:hypothetical protein
MGRPSACDCRCGGDDPPGPPITDCENLLCVVFMDENSPGIPDEKMQGFIDAFPNRVLIVLDVFGGQQMAYTTKFINHPRAFSLRLEYDADPTGLIRFIGRDAGLLSVAETNDPWGRIKTILDRYGLTDWLNDDNSEVSIFVDNSGSSEFFIGGLSANMTAAHVSATVSKLETDLQLDGKTRTESIYNGAEDIICPFVVSECCTGDAAGALASLCGYSWNCPEFAEINLVATQGQYYSGLLYVLRVDGSSYRPGDTIIREVGTQVTFQLLGVEGRCGGGQRGPFVRLKSRSPSLGPVSFNTGGNYGDFTFFGDGFPPKVNQVYSFTMPQGGLDIWVQVYCVYS